jgi:hypothetical protein
MAERQVSWMRARYLQTVLRQYLEYFDLRASSMHHVYSSRRCDARCVVEGQAKALPELPLPSVVKPLG